jgi:aspartate racemase
MKSRKTQKEVVGILGGMGPEATIDLFTKIVKGSKVKKDQDHLRILIDNNPQIPDRTLAIRGKGPNPLPKLIQSARALEQAGAGFILIPCITAHHFFDPLQRRIRTPILHILNETLGYIQTQLKEVHRIGIIATTGTVHAGLFQKTFANGKIELIFPAPETQKKCVMEAIYGKRGIKAIGPSENSRRLILKASKELMRRGAQGIIAGCTEIPLVLKEGDLPIRVIDPLSILAGAAIEKAGGKVK